MGHCGLGSLESLSELFCSPSVILKQEERCDEQHKDASDVGRIDIRVDDIICTYSHVYVHTYINKHTQTHRYIPLIRVLP